MPVSCVVMGSVWEQFLHQDKVIKMCCIWPCCYVAFSLGALALLYERLTVYFLQARGFQTVRHASPWGFRRIEEWRDVTAWNGRDRCMRELWKQREVMYCSLAGSPPAAAAAVTHSSWRQLRYFKTLSTQLLQFASKIALLLLGVITRSNLNTRTHF